MRKAKPSSPRGWNNKRAWACSPRTYYRKPSTICYPIASSSRARRSLERLIIHTCAVVHDQVFATVGQRLSPELRHAMDHFLTVSEGGTTFSLLPAERISPRRDHFLAPNLLAALSHDRRHRAGRSGAPRDDAHVFGKAPLQADETLQCHGPQALCRSQTVHVNVGLLAGNAQSPTGSSRADARAISPRPLSPCQNRP